MAVFSTRAHKSCPSRTVPAAVASGPSGVIVLSVGQAQLWLEGQVDAATLTLLWACLLP